MSALTWLVFTTSLAAGPSPQSTEAQPLSAPAELEAEQPLRRSASVRGSILAEGFELDLGQIMLELSCACMREVQRARPDLSGGFLYAGLPPGRYTLRALHGERVAQVLVVDLQSERESAVVLRIDAPPAPLPSYSDTATATATADGQPAAGPTDGTPDARPAGAVLTHPVDDGVGLRRYGLGFTVIGAVLGLGGLIAGYHNPCGKDGARGSNCATDLRNTVAWGMGVTALGAMTGGIISMAVGHSLRRRARLDADLAVQLGPAQFGVGLRFRL